MEIILLNDLLLYGGEGDELLAIGQLVQLLYFLWNEWATSLFSVSDPHLLLCGFGSWSQRFSIWIRIGGVGGAGLLHKKKNKIRTWKFNLNYFLILHKKNLRLNFRLSINDYTVCKFLWYWYFFSLFNLLSPQEQSGSGWPFLMRSRITKHCLCFLVYTQFMTVCF